MIRALVVDDEPLARKRVVSLLKDDIAVAGEASHGAEAVDMIAEFKPDLVFLDIQMPEMSGFDVIAAVGVDDMPATVFITAFDAYAVQAFEVQALDYLLKPFDDERFAKVLSRARQRLSQSGGIRKIMAEQPPKLIARSRGVMRVIHLEDIDWIGAAGDYAEVHCKGRSYLIDDSLSALTARLPAGQFVRIHRAAIVRLDRVAEIRTGAHGDGALRLICGTELRVSRRFREGLTGLLA
jgi:two-component system, LytTR family, response regulator